MTTELAHPAAASPDQGTTNRLLGRIILADDDAAFRESTARLLEGAGLQCAEADSAPAAQQLLADGEWDLLIADIHMPGNVNLELLEFAAGQPGTLSVLVVTGQPSVQTAARAVQAHVAGYLIKPIETSAMLELVRREVQATRLRRLIQKRRTRVETVLAQLQELEQTAQRMRFGGNERELRAYLAMFSEHIISSLRDLVEFVEAAAAQKTTEENWRRVASARPFQLTEVLRETVQVLEQTKTAFKSRELADMRKRLQILLDAPAV